MGGTVQGMAVGERMKGAQAGSWEACKYLSGSPGPCLEGKEREKGRREARGDLSPSPAIVYLYATPPPPPPAVPIWMQAPSSAPSRLHFLPSLLGRDRTGRGGTAIVRPALLLGMELNALPLRPPSCLPTTPSPFTLRPSFTLSLPSPLHLSRPLSIPRYQLPQCYRACRSLGEGVGRVGEGGLD